jgi:biopolymer transport protein ExbD
MASSQSRPGEMISGINVTPLVDVVLVLLIVLMVTASYTVSKALPMNLPKASTGESQSHPLAISLDEKGLLFLDGTKVSLGELSQKVRERKAAGDVSALIAADGLVQHRSVVQVIDLLRIEGVTQFAINVAPSDIVPSGATPTKTASSHAPPSSLQ